MYVQLPFEVFLTLLIVVLLMIAAKLEKQLPEIQEISFFHKFLNPFHRVIKHIIVGASVLSSVPSSCQQSTDELDGVCKRLSSYTLDVTSLLKFWCAARIG